MPTMFPTPASGGDDANRRPRKPYDGTGTPPSLKWAFAFFIGAAILMVLTGLVLYTAGYTGPTDTDAQYQEVVVNNQRFIGMVNGLAGIVIAALISQVPRSGKNIRRLLLAIALLVVLVDLLSFVTRAGGPSLALIALLLAAGCLLLFRPDVNDLVAQNHRTKQMRG